MPSSVIHLHHLTSVCLVLPDVVSRVTLSGTLNRPTVISASTYRLFISDANRTVMYVLTSITPGPEHPKAVSPTAVPLRNPSLPSWTGPFLLRQEHALAITSLNYLSQGLVSFSDGLHIFDLVQLGSLPPSPLITSCSLLMTCGGWQWDRRCPAQPPR